MADYNSNYVDDGSDYVVVEADEFDRSFLTLTPYISAVISMDPDHLDIYGSQHEVLRGFKDFINKTIPGGTVYLHRSTVSKFTADEFYVLQRTYEILTFGDSTSDIYADNIRFEEDGTTKFDFHYKTQLFSDVTINMPGRHNVSNATVAMSIGLQLKLSPKVVFEAISGFKGIKRRFEIIVKTPDCIYIDDYAHHPEELRNAIATAKSIYPDQKITGIFQPHLFSRTRDFMAEFAEVLDELDEPILLDIYPARELPIEGITSAALLSKMSNPNKRLMDFDSVCEYISITKPKVLITLGAGDIDTIVPKLKKILS